MTIIQHILDLLENEPLTSLELAERLGMDKDLIFPKLSRLHKENRIMAINNEKPYKYTVITKKIIIKQLKFLMDFFEMNKDILIKNNQDFLIKNEETFQFIVTIIKESEM